MSTGKIIGALLLGAAAGSVLTLLFTTRKGNKIKDNIDELLDELTDKIDEGKDMLSGLKEKVAAKAEHLKTPPEDNSETGRSRARQTTHQ